MYSEKIEHKHLPEVGTCVNGLFPKNSRKAQKLLKILFALVCGTHIMITMFSYFFQLFQQKMGKFFKGNCELLPLIL
jgi:hypothetical protein